MDRGRPVGRTCSADPSCRTGACAVEAPGGCERRGSPEMLHHPGGGRAPPGVAKSPGQAPAELPKAKCGAGPSRGLKEEACCRRQAVSRLQKNLLGLLGARTICNRFRPAGPGDRQAQADLSWVAKILPVTVQARDSCRDPGGPGRASGISLGCIPAIHRSRSRELLPAGGAAAYGDGPGRGQGDSVRVPAADAGAFGDPGEPGSGEHRAEGTDTEH